MVLFETLVIYRSCNAQFRKSYGEKANMIGKYMRAKTWLIYLYEKKNIIGQIFAHKYFIRFNSQFGCGRHVFCWLATVNVAGFCKRLSVFSIGVILWYVWSVFVCLCACWNVIFFLSNICHHYFYVVAFSNAIAKPYQAYRSLALFKYEYSFVALWTDLNV